MYGVTLDYGGSLLVTPLSSPKLCSVSITITATPSRFPISVFGFLIPPTRKCARIPRNCIKGSPLNIDKSGLWRPH